MAYIELHDVVKDFKIKNRRNGAFGNVKNFFAPQYLTKRAVDHISLEINRGEMVGYIGPMERANLRQSKYSRVFCCPPAAM